MQHFIQTTIKTARVPACKPSSDREKKSPASGSSREGLAAYLKPKLATDDQFLGHAQSICEGSDFVRCLLDSLVNLVQPPSLQSNAHCLLKLAVPEAPRHKRTCCAKASPGTLRLNTGSRDSNRLVVAKEDTHLSKSRSTIADNLSSIGFAFPSSVVSFLSWTY